MQRCWRYQSIHHYYTIHKHLELANTWTKLLFADFSSAFNTMQPHILAQKLSSHFYLDNQLILLIIDSLTNWTQRVLFNNTFSGLLHTSTGLRHLTAALHPLQWLQPKHHLVKLANATTNIAPWLSPAGVGGVVWQLLSANECGQAKEMVVTFSNKQRELAAAVTKTIHRRSEGIVKDYRYMGTIFALLLKIASNAEEILRKCQLRQYLLKKLNSFARSSSNCSTELSFKAGWKG